MTAMQRRAIVILAGISALVLGLVAASERGQASPSPETSSEFEQWIAANESAARGHQASEVFPPDIAKQIDGIPVGERLDYRVVDCGTLPGLDFEPKGCISATPSQRVRAVDPNITSNQLREWDGSNYEPSEISSESCEALSQVGYDGPICEAQTGGK